MRHFIFILVVICSYGWLRTAGYINQLPEQQISIFSTQDNCLFCAGSGQEICNCCGGDGEKTCWSCAGVGEFGVYSPKPLKNGFQYVAYQGQTEYVLVWDNHKADFPCRKCNKIGEIPCDFSCCQGTGQQTCSMCDGRRTAP